MLLLSGNSWGKTVDWNQINIHSRLSTVLCDYIVRSTTCARTHKIPCFFFIFLFLSYFFVLEMNSLLFSLFQPTGSRLFHGWFFSFLFLLLLTRLLMTNNVLFNNRSAGASEAAAISDGVIELTYNKAMLNALYVRTAALATSSCSTTVGIKDYTLKLSLIIFKFRRARNVFSPWW